MAEKAKKDNKNLIIGICAAIAVVLVVVVAVMLVSKGSTQLGDSYFVTDDTKYVLNLDTNYVDEEEEYAPLKTHIVYFRSGDKITGMKSYYEYANDNDAKAAYDMLKSIEEYKNANLSTEGKYIVITASEEEYANLTPSEVEEQIEFMEMLQNMNLDDEDEDTEDTEEDEENDVIENEDF